MHIIGFNEVCEASRPGRIYYMCNYLLIIDICNRCNSPIRSNAALYWWKTSTATEYEHLTKFQDCCAPVHSLSFRKVQEIRKGKTEIMIRDVI